MRSRLVNQLMYASGIIILLAILTYFIQGSGVLLNSLLILASISAGIPTFYKAWQASKHKMFSIELLVTIAVIGALIIGEYVESAAVTFLFLFGAFLEARSLEKARNSLRSLMDMAPLEASVIRDGVRTTIHAEDVVKDDLLVVQTGEKIAVDGRVVSGTASVNEAAITGESVPKTKRLNDKVFSGSIVDNGYIEVIAEQVGEDTTFSKIIELVEEAQEGKAKTQRFLEQFARYYTPGILVLSLLVGLITRDVHLALTFLVISCPGALVISAPVSIVAGIGNAARNGILIKGGEVMENLAKITAVVFDKTGTLTKGSPQVTAIKSYGISEDDLLRKAAEAEMVSEHHLARAIVQAAEEKSLEITNKPSEIEILKGRGLQVVLDGEFLYLGNRKGLEAYDIRIPSEVESYALHQEGLGNTAVFVTDKTKIIGIISIADAIREEAKESLAQLKSNGIRDLVMLTGDNRQTAALVGEQLGLTKVVAEMLPEDKSEKVKACMEKGKHIAMLGDGVNDAPALATADVGIAMGVAGTDVAMETADVILMSDDLAKLPHAINLARATRRNMKQNVFIAVGTVAVLLAGVLTKNVNLASGMLFHELSVLAVILNAIRLVNYKQRDKDVVRESHELKPAFSA